MTGLLRRYRVWRDTRWFMKYWDLHYWAARAHAERRNKR